MKKLLIVALAFMAGATFAFTPGKNKKEKKQPVAPVVEQVALITPSDTLSYAAGVATTRGLDTYITQQFGVDSAHMADFEAGLQEGLRMSGDPKFVARAAGYQIAQMLESRILPQAKGDFEGTVHAVDSTMFVRGFIDAVKGDTTVMTQARGTQIFNDTRTAEKQAKEQAYKLENEQWLKDNALKEGVVTTESGLQYKVLVAGDGEKPGKSDKVTVKYEGRMIDGTEFDSSYKRNPQTSEFRADQVIKGWTEALTLMPVGSKWELYIPQDLAYGSRQAGKIKPFSTLIFTVELVKFDKADTEKKPQPAPVVKPATLKKATAAKKK